MESLLFHSDTLLRPDVGLVLPFLAAYTRNWPLLLLSTALQPLKWQSGCACFVKLCLRKRRSIRVSIFLAAVAPAMHFWLALPTNNEQLLGFAAIVAVVLTFESGDTKTLKAMQLGAALLLPKWMAVAFAMVVSWVYAYGTGWKVRGKEAVDVLAANSVWLVTRDGRLAKRVNNVGEFHLEYVVGGKEILVGDGRLVGEKGAGLKNGLLKGRFIESEGNLKTLKVCMETGKVVVKGDDVAIVA